MSRNARETHLLHVARPGPHIQGAHQALRAVPGTGQAQEAAGGAAAAAATAPAGADDGCRL